MAADERGAAGIDRLVAEGRLAEAAERCAQAGEHRRAAKLFEQACEFDRGAEQALVVGALAQAATLASLGRNRALQRQVCRQVLEAGQPDLARQVAADLAARGHHRSAAELYRGVDEHRLAADAFDRAGAVLESAACFERAGQPADAARLLEATLRSGGVPAAASDPSSDGTGVDPVRVALGRLYARHGRYEPAVRVLQQVATNSSLRRDALPALARSLEQLGLRQAHADLHDELTAHGIDSTTVAAELAASADDPAGADHATRLYGRYDVVDEVATTPHAKVVRATDRITGDEVAVKVFASRSRGSGRDALQRFAREAKVLMQLRHPNVVPLREFIAEGPAMVLDWMAGGSLRDLIEREPISPARAAEITGSLLGALAEAHRVGILHRDVKPSNLLFDEGGTAKLADFGAAHWSDSAATVTAAEIGTVAYMAPEQVRGQAATVRSDIYSAGVLLYEMITRRRPKQGWAISRGHVDLDDSHDGLLAHMIAQDPAERFEEAVAARRALESLSWSTRAFDAPSASLGEVATPAKPRGPTDRLAPPREPPHFEDPDRQRHDAWLGRDVLVLPLDEPTRLRAATFARADHPALPTILRADSDRSEIWIEAPRGTALSRLDGKLNASEHALLAAALQTLHQLAGVHGCVDGDHVMRHAGSVYLAWPRHPAKGVTAEDDGRGLASLRD